MVDMDTRTANTLGFRSARQKPAARVVIFGLDSMSWDIVDRVAEAMPVLSRLRREGASGTLMSTLPPITPVAWTSLVTGMSPGRHGVFEFVHRNGDGTWHPVTRRQVRAPGLDERLEATGRPSVLVNLPVSHPGRSGAIRLQDFLSPDPTPVDPPELLERFPDLQSYRPFYSTGPIADKSVSQMVAEVSDLEDRRFAAARAILTHEPWQYLFYGVTGTDHLHHRALNEILGPAPVSPEILSFYRGVDDALAWVADQLTADDLLIVASDHGSAVLTREFYLNSYLVSEGYASWKTAGSNAREDGPSASTTPSRRDQAIRAAREMAFRLGLDARTRRLRQRLGIRAGRAGAPARVDEERSKAYMPGPFAWPALFVNGTEGEIESLRDKLRELTDPMTGRTVFAQVLTAQEAYGPDRAPGCPDLVLLPGPGMSVHPGRSSALFRAVTKNHHKRDGMVLLYGGQASELPRNLGERPIEDVAATVLDAFGLPVPGAMEGTSMLPMRPQRQVREAVRAALGQIGRPQPRPEPQLRAASGMRELALQDSGF